MQRVIIVSILSFAAGAGVSYGLLYDAASAPERERVAARPSLPRASDPVADLGELSPAAPAVAERARVYGLVANAGTDELETMARDALSRVDRSGRSFELDAVLARLIELDPDAALAFARERNLGRDRQLDVALSVLDTFGYSDRSIDDILAALPGLDRNQFRMLALERLASIDPAQALGNALEDLNSSSAFGAGFGPLGFGGPQTLLRIAAVWAGRDPDGALAAIDTIVDTQARFMFAQAVLGRVAQSDPDAVLAYVDAMNMPEPQKMGLVQTAIAQLASRDPQRAIQYAEALGGQTGQMAVMMAAQQWAQRDAAAAIAYVEAMPAGMARQNLLQQLASAFGRSDPDAALAWAQSPTSGQAQVYAGVLAGIAQSDPVRALDLAFDESLLRLSPGGQMQALMSVIGNAAGTGAVPHRTLADRILTLENGQARQNALQMLGQTWASADVDSALYWFMNNQESIGPSVLGNLARQLGHQNPQSAAQYTSLVLPELRSEWISAIASGYAQTDLDGARAWVQQFRGEPVYEAAVTEIIRYSAGSDPAGAAALLASIDFSNQASDTQLVSAIAGSWASQDWPAARNWVATLPRGETRDNALTGMISIGRELPDASVMGLFSNDDRRLGAIQSVIMQTAQFDPERARAMVAEYFDEPQRREQAEQMIENMQSGQPLRGFSSQAFISQGVPVMVPAIGIRGEVAPVVVR